MVNVHLVIRENFVKLLRLNDITRKTVKQNSIFTLWGIQVVLNEANHQLIGDEFAGSHETMGRLAERTSRSNSFTKHISSG
jgi:hypothetical protein